MRRFLTLVLLLAACGGSSGRTEVLVSAASSLTDAFAALESAFEEGQPDVDIVLNLGGSSTLATQIVEGAPVDVFASADESTMHVAVDGGLVDGGPEVLARNRLVIAVPSGNPGGVTALADFRRADLLLGLCASGVPCGELARRALTEAGVDAEIDTEEPNVRALLTKIAAGELDAGIVYATDVTGPDVEAVPIAPAVSTDYLIAVLSNAPDAAREFTAFVLSDEGQSILRGYGFESP